MGLSGSCVTWRSLTQFGGVPKHRRGADSGWEYCHLCDGHKLVERPEGPGGAPRRSAQGVRQRCAAELLEGAEGSAHTAGWWWGTVNVHGVWHFCCTIIFSGILFFPTNFIRFAPSVIFFYPDIFYAGCSFEAAPHHPFLWAWVGPGRRRHGERGSGRKGREDQRKSPGYAGVQHELTADYHRGTSSILHQVLLMNFAAFLLTSTPFCTLASFMGVSRSRQVAAVVMKGKHRNHDVYLTSYQMHIIYHVQQFSVSLFPRNPVF